MKQIFCPHEAAALRAGRTGHWQESLRTHVAECASCQETVQLSRWMQGLAQGVEWNLALPDADLLWWKARLAQRQAEVERAQKPLEWVEVGVPATIAVGLAGWLAWNWPSVQTWLAKLLVGMLPQLWKTTWAVASSATALSTSAALPLVLVLCLVAILLAHPLLAED